LIFFNIGNCFSVDGIIIDACSVLVDESCLRGQSKKINKVPLHLVPDQNEHNLTPFLISGSKIIGGSGVMLVLAVGE
jgi:Ca2+ transporting ATPase